MEIDFKESKTGNGPWKNPFISMEERLLMADGAIQFRDEVIANLRKQIHDQKELLIRVVGG